MKFQFDTDQYEFSHGRKPKGYGYWMFQAANMNEPVSAYGTLTEAKRSAKAQISAAGYATPYMVGDDTLYVEVLP